LLEAVSVQFALHIPIWHAGDDGVSLLSGALAMIAQSRYEAGYSLLASAFSGRAK
jgi:hypothetical protein